MAATVTPVLRHWSQKYFREFGDVYSDIYENRQFNAIYLTMLVMAGLIALLGLLVNSPAVIIGAMLISPLMGPILSCGLALTLADWDLGKKGLRNILLSVFEVLLITALVTALSPLNEPTAEILARSNPNLMDLLIAFFSGVAGSIALVTRSKTGLTIIPGVAIATAVMPPLATTGFGLATAQWQIARGSFMLFFTNLVAIIISADLVFFIAGFRPQLRESEASPKYIRARVIIALLILGVISIPLIRTLARAAQQARVRGQIQAALKSLEKPHNTQLGNWRFELEPDRVIVDASLITSQPAGKEVIEQTERTLSELLSRKAELHISQIRAEDGAATRDFLSGGNRATAPAPPKPAEEFISEYQNRIYGLLRQLSQPVGFSDLKVSAVGVQGDGSINVLITAKRNEPAEPEMIAVFASALQRELAHPVNLKADLLVGEARLKFLNASNRLDQKSVAELRKLREISTRTGRAVITGGQPDAMNARRVRLIETALGTRSSSNIQSSLGLAQNEVLVRLEQAVSVQYGAKREFAESAE